ncbi:Calcineurin phosphoesterase [mine drainage metagenome]|uniref:Calcineurin phosphoesterase n=1 Tax=mine drainage metagenome TaxID=410659 RepID=T0ZQQ2_9ZZZZ
MVMIPTASDDLETPDFSDPPIRLVQLSDFHLIGDPESTLDSGIAPEPRLKRVLAALAEENRPDLLLVTGDLAHRGSAPVYDRIAESLAAFGIPWYVIPGNHDDPGLLRRRLGPELMPEAIQIGAWRILLLDSTVAGAPSGEIGARALARLGESIAGNRVPHTLIALHHPPLATGTSWLDAIGLTNSEAFLAHLAAAQGVRGVLFGHLHQDFEAARDGIVYLGCPSTAMQFPRGSPSPVLDPSRGGWRSLELHASGRLASQVHWVDFSREV